MGLYHQLINHRGLQPRFFKIGEAKRIWKKFPYLVYAELISGEIGATFKMKLFGKEKFILTYAQTNDMKIQWSVSATSAKDPKEQHKLQLRVRRERYVESKAKLAQNIRSLNTILSHYLNSPLNQVMDNSHLPENMKISRKEESSESNNEMLADEENNGGKNEGKQLVENKEKEQEEGKSIKEEKQPVKQNKGAKGEIKPITNKEGNEKQPVQQNKESGKRGEDEKQQPVKQLSNEKQSVKVEKILNEISTQNVPSTSSNAKTNLKRIQAQANAKANMKKIQAQYSEPQLPDSYENDVNAKMNIHAQYDEPQFPDPVEQTTYHKPKIVKRQTQKKPISYIKKKPIGSPTYN